MQTALVQQTGSTAITSERPRRVLPSILTEEIWVEGYHAKLWLPVVAEGADRVAAQQALLEIETRLTPADDKTILVMLTALAEYYDLKQTGAALTTRLTMMVEDLRGYSAYHLEQTIKDHRQQCNFFPKSAELRERLLTRRTMADVLKRRAKIALGLQEPSDWEKALIRKVEDEKARKAADDAPPAADLEDKIAQLPPALQESTRRIMDGARKSREAVQERDA